jgi:hypothetical protein
VLEKLTIKLLSYYLFDENNPENIDQEMIVDVIVESQEFMDDTAPPSQSQQPLVPLLFHNFKVLAIYSA